MFYTYVFDTATAYIYIYICSDVLPELGGSYRPDGMQARWAKVSKNQTRRSDEPNMYKQTTQTVRRR